VTDPDPHRTHPEEREKAEEAAAGSGSFIEDKVVPPNQSRLMADALRDRGVPVAHVEFEGEGHGFRDAANIRRALEAELWFYGRVFGFEPAGEPPDLTIDNLRG